ncbi:glycogen phosphorylase domain protein [Mycobacterium kansasii 824]|nr:glycogen phosphorylase domain protein [Mycobacterium kansasii 824]
MSDVIRSSAHASTAASAEAAASTSAEDVRTGMSSEALRQAIEDHLRYSLGRPATLLQPKHYYRALALAVRDRMQRRWIETTQTYLNLSRKVACYLSAEFLLGPHLGNNLLNLQLEGQARTALAALGQDLDEVLACEEEPGLGNGGWAGWRPATWTHWPPWSVRPSVMASAMSSAFSTRKSTTAGRSRKPTTGWPTAIRGRSPSPN